MHCATLMSLPASSHTTMKVYFKTNNTIIMSYQRRSQEEMYQIYDINMIFPKFNAIYIIMKWYLLTSFQWKDIYWYDGHMIVIMKIYNNESISSSLLMCAIAAKWNLARIVARVAWLAESKRIAKIHCSLYNYIINNSKIKLLFSYFTLRILLLSLSSMKPAFKQCRKNATATGISTHVLAGSFMTHFQWWTLKIY